MADSSTAAGNPPFDRQARILELVDRIRQDAVAGQDWNLESVCARYAELLPELRSELLKLQIVINGIRLSQNVAPHERVRYFGDYEIIETIGRGGMGVVYKARQLSLERIVALKMIRGGELAKSEHIRRFRAEALSVAQLQHPGIVTLFETGEDKGLHFICMEYVEGQSLSATAREQPFSAEAAARCMIAIAEAVQFAHSRGVLHRDLKPSNVLIGADGRPRVTDFGLAKRMDFGADDADDLTLTNEVLGTPSYMPPEQAEGRFCEPAPTADVYSLGAILYELLTGRPPFRAATPLETLDQVKTLEPVSPRRLNPHTPVDLETICLKCLEKDPACRYATVQALGDELGRFLRDEPILARPLGRVSRAVRWCRRQPLLVTAMVLAIALVAILLIGGPVVAVREAALKQQAESEEAAAKRQARIADVRRLTAESRSAREDFPIRSTLLALEAIRQTAEDEPVSRAAAENELRACLSRIGGWPLQVEVNNVSASDSGRWLVTIGNDNKIRLWDLASDNPVPEPRVVGSYDMGYGWLQVSPDGHWLVAVDVDTWKVDLLDLTSTDGLIKSRTCPKHESASTVFSPDGRWLVYAISDSVWLWDLKSDDPVAEELRGWSTKISDIAFSPDGHWLALSGDKSAHLWSLGQDDARTLYVLKGHNNEVGCLEFSPDGHWILTGDKDGVAKLWNLTLYDPSADPKEFRGNGASIECLAFSPDTQSFATASIDGSTRLWGLKDDADPIGKLPWTFYVGDHAIQSIEFSPDGRWLITNDASNTAALWNLSSPLPDTRPRILRSDQNTNSVDLNISPDGRWLVAVYNKDKPHNYSVMVFDLALEDPSARSRDLVGHEGNVRVVAFSSDGHWVVTHAIDDNTCRIWDLTRENEGTNFEFPCDGGENEIGFSPNSHMLVTELNSLITLWDLALADPSSHPQTIRGSGENGEKVSCFALSPDGYSVAIGCWDNAARIWQVSPLDPFAPYESHVLLGHKEMICRLTFSRDGRYLATGSFDGTVTIWNLVTGTSIHVLVGHKHGIDSLTFSSDGRWIVTTDSFSIQLWDLESKDPVSNKIVVEEGTGLFAMSVDGTWLAAKGDSDNVRIWDLSLPNPKANGPVLSAGNHSSCLGFSPNRRQLAAGNHDGSITLWDLTKEVNWNHPQVLRGHEGRVRCLAFSQDGRWLATGGDDGATKLWSLMPSDPAPSPLIMPIRDKSIESIVFSPNGNWLATRSEQVVSLWDLRLDRLVALANSVAGRPLSQAERERYQIIDATLQQDLPPISIRDVLPGWPTDARFHERMAAEARARKDAFGAAFHEARSQRFRSKDSP